MTDETILLDKLQEKIILSGRIEELADYLDYYYTDGSSIIGGHPVMQSTASVPSVKGLTTNQPFLGLALDYNVEADKKESYSLGVTIADNKLISVLRPTGGRVRAQVTFARSTTTAKSVIKGTPLYWSVTESLKVTNVAPTTQGYDIMRFAGVLDEDLASGTADKVIVMRY